jgi:hypothetical protein
MEEAEGGEACFERFESLLKFGSIPYVEGRSRGFGGGLNVPPPKVASSSGIVLATLSTRWASRSGVLNPSSLRPVSFSSIRGNMHLLGLSISDI